MKTFYRILLFMIILPLCLGAQVILADFLVNDPAQNTAGVGRTAIAAAANGNFAVAWQDWNVYGVPIPAMPRVAVQMFSADVTPIGPGVLFNGESRNLFIYDNDYLTGDIDLEFLPNGRLLVAVEHEGLLSTIGDWVFSWEAGIGAVSETGQIIDLTYTTGVILWWVPLDLIDWGNLRLSVAPSGDFLAVTNGPSFNTGYSGVLIQQFDMNVNFIGNYFTPHPTDPGPNFNHYLPDVATNGNLHLVVWQDGRQDANYDITAQFYTNSGELGGNILVNNGDLQGTINGWPSLAMNLAGTSLVVWADTREGADGEIFGQRFAASGQPLGTNFQISSGQGRIWDRPEVAMRADGSFMVVWTDSMQGISGLEALRARARQYDSAANPTGPPFVVPDQDMPSALVNIATNGTHYYASWLDARLDNVTPNVYAKIVGDIFSDVEPLGDGLPPSEFVLGPNYPNPFNPTTQFEYRIADFGYVWIDIYDVQGRHVRNITGSAMAAGRYTGQWDGRDDSGLQVSSGVYYYRLVVKSAFRNPQSAIDMTRKMILLR